MRHNITLRMTTHPITCVIQDDEGRDRCEFCNFEVQWVKGWNRITRCDGYWRHRVASHLLADDPLQAL
jgi:hypothetical protein